MSLTEQRTHSSSVFSNPLPDECRAYLVVGDDGAVVALGGFVQFDPIILDRSGLELLGDALLHIASCLSDFKETL